jgi:hypothetical protein
VGKKGNSNGGDNVEEASGVIFETIVSYCGSYMSKLVSCAKDGERMRTRVVVVVVCALSKNIMEYFVPPKEFLAPK